jgi:RHS repeat-associated protein
MVVTCPAVQARDVTYYYVDPQGSVLATADAVGQITSASDFTPFGIRVPAAVTNQIGYIGQIEDVESGLDYFQARYYDPLTGRFLSEDPLPMEDGDGFDRYSYGNNSPYVFVDPSGMDGENTTPTPPGPDEPPVVVTASYVDPPFIAPFGGQGDNPPQPGVDPVQ